MGKHKTLAAHGAMRVYLSMFYFPKSLFMKYLIALFFACTYLGTQAQIKGVVSDKADGKAVIGRCSHQLGQLFRLRQMLRLQQKIVLFD